MRPRSLLLPIALLIAGCGLKGPLALPDKADSVQVRPARGTPATVPEPASSTAPATAPEAPSATSPATGEQSAPATPAREPRPDSATQTVPEDRPPGTARE